MSEAVIKYYIAHRFKDEIIIPFCALTNNIDFCIEKDAEKVCLTADNVRCVAESFDEKHICELEADVKRIYGIQNTWDFIKRWYALDKHMDSMYFLKISLKKI